MDLKELSKKNRQDWEELLAFNRDKLRDLRFKDSNKQLKDVRAIRQTKRFIARLLTLINNNKQ